MLPDLSAGVAGLVGMLILIVAVSGHVPLTEIVSPEFALLKIIVPLMFRTSWPNISPVRCSNNVAVTVPNAPIKSTLRVAVPCRVAARGVINTELFKNLNVFFAVSFLALFLYFFCALFTWRHR